MNSQELGEWERSNSSKILEARNMWWVLHDLLDPGTEHPALAEGKAENRSVYSVLSPKAQELALEVEVGGQHEEDCWKVCLRGSWIPSLAQHSQNCPSHTLAKPGPWLTGEVKRENLWTWHSWGPDSVLKTESKWILAYCMLGPPACPPVPAPGMLAARPLSRERKTVLWDVDPPG